ncbi:MAG TPA: PIN domain-containing protein [archaeon]|nr:PIN domain-containing protein [archaeon]
MTGFEKQIIDTNILVYLADKADKEKHRKITKWFEGKEENIYYLSLQSLREFASVTVRKKIISVKEIIEWLSIFEKRFRILKDNQDDILVALENMKNSFWDALLYATMKRNEITSIISENEKDFEKFEGIKVHNIFKEKN